MDATLGDVIRGTMAEAGLEPVEFEKPLKSITALVRLKKEYEPKSLVERHSLLGWGLSNLLDWFGKEMWCVRELNMTHDKKAVKIEAVIALSYLTHEDDHEAWMNERIADIPGKEWRSGSYHWTPRFWHWDSAERIGDVEGFTQMCGDGIATGHLGEGG